jgi:hypothetical protein
MASPSPSCPLYPPLPPPCDCSGSSTPTGFRTGLFVMITVFGAMAIIPMFYLICNCDLARTKYREKYVDTPEARAKREERAATRRAKQYAR